MGSLKLLAYCVLFVSLACALPAGARTWSSASGKNQIEAEFVTVEGDNVQLRREDGRVITVPLAKLSAEDQEFVKQQTATTTERNGETSNDFGVRVELIGLEIGKPMPAEPKEEDGFTMVMMGSQGTTLRLWLQDKKRPILGLDQEKSKLTSLVDDRGTDLTKGKEEPGGRFAQFGFGGMSSQPFRVQVADDRQSCNVDVTGAGWPTAGATTITLEATLVLKVGTELGEAEAPAIGLTEGEELAAGPITFVVERTSPDGGFGDAQMMLTLKTNDSLDAIEKIEFIDADGAVIEHDQMGSMTAGFGDNAESQIDYGLAKKVDKAGMRISYYQTVESVEVPVKITTGVGF